MLVLLKNIDIDAFLTTLKYHLNRPDEGWLPDKNCIQDFHLTANVPMNVYSPPVSLDLYFVQEHDRLVGTKRFIFLRTKRGEDILLEREAKRLFAWFNAEGIKVYFRIDPIYGLVIGRSKKAIQPSIAREREYYIITLVAAESPDHPEIALQDYVPDQYRDTFLSLFERYNRSRPGKTKLFGFDISKILKRQTEKEKIDFFVWDYGLFHRFLMTLTTQYLWRDIWMDIIFRDVSEDDFKRSPLPRESLFYFPQDTFRFFHDVEEIMVKK